MTIEEPSEVRDSFIIIDKLHNEESKQPTRAMPKVESLDRKSRSPYRVRDPSPQIA